MKLFIALVLVSLWIGGCSSLRTAPNFSGPLTKPVVPGDRPDPFIYRWNGTYFLTHTQSNGIPIFESSNLTQWREVNGAFPSPNVPPHLPWRINGKGFCHVWAPEFFSPEGGKDVVVTFSAVAYEGKAIPDTCPPFDGNTAIYAMTSSQGMTGPFAQDPLEPVPMGTNRTCASPYPHSPGRESGCALHRCAEQMRIDGSYFTDAGKTYFAYVWFSNPQARTWEEKRHHGFNISVTEMSSKDPRQSECPPQGKSWHVVSPGDKALLKRLAASCPQCSERLSFSKTGEGTEWVWRGTLAGIVEGPSLFRRGEWVYLLFSHAHYDSAYYAVSWIAAKTVEELANPATRQAGRYLIPSGPYGYGHGTPFLSTDQKSTLYVYHRIDSEACQKNTGRKCERDIFISPLEFDGPVIRPFAPKGP